MPRGIAAGTATRRLERPVVRKQRLPSGMVMDKLPRGVANAQRQLHRGGGKSALMRYAERMARHKASNKTRANPRRIGVYR